MRVRNKEAFIERAKQVHGERYDYSRVNYLRSQHKVTIVCRKHGEFLQTPNHHLNSQGCCQCGHEQRAESTANTPERVVERFKKIHGNRYDYSKVKYKSNKTPVEIICRIHGSFMQKPSHHYKGQGCRLCGIEVCKNPLKTTEEFIADARKVHGDRYSYEKTVYTMSKYYVIITCKKHGNFKVTANGHLCGQNCHRCANNNRSSVSDEWLDSLNVNVREHWVPNTSYKVDGFDPKTNTIYEYCGAFWHGHPKYYRPNDINPVNGKSFGDLFKSTIDRFKTLKSLGYKLRVKWEIPSNRKIS